MSTATEGLMYHGRPLTPQPAGAIMLGEYVQMLLDGGSVSLYLEPGDGTRYCLTIAPVRWREERDEMVVLERLAVVRSSGSGGDFRSAALLPDPNESDEIYYEDEIHRLADGNEWTMQVFNWWFGILWERIRAAEDAR